MHKVAKIIHGRWVIPLEEKSIEKVQENHSIAISSEGKIVAIQPKDTMDKEYESDIIIDRSKNHIQHPGQINAHTHLGMTLLRGYSDDKVLMDWQQKDIWPCEGEFANDKTDFIYISSLLGISEMIRGGTTCFNDMYNYPKELARAMKDMKIRGIIGGTLMTQDWLPPINEQFKANESVMNEFKDEKLIGYSCAPHAPYTVSDESFIQCREWMKKYDNVFMHIHLHETKLEVDYSKSLKKVSPCHLSDQPISPIMNLSRLEQLNDKLTSVHMTCLSDDEITQLGENKCSVIHCPTSNQKLASGFCPVSKQLDKKVNVGIGTDSTASNNTLDMYAEMKLCSILSKAVSGDPTCIPAPYALCMATINNAKAQHIDDRIGSQTIGKEADIVALEMKDIEFQPQLNIIAHIVYVANRSCVTDVWVNGEEQLTDRKLQTIDEAYLLEKVVEWEHKLKEFKFKNTEKSI